VRAHARTPAFAAAAAGRSSAERPLRARRKLAFVLSLATGVVLAGCGAGSATGARAGAATAETAGADRWEPEIAAFEAADRTTAPPAGGVVFVGSSSIRLWQTLEEDFEGVAVVNRGFGGSEMSDALHFVDRIVIPYQPRLVVVYAGDNDLWGGESPRQVFQDFRSLVERIHRQLPGTRVAFIAVKPSVARWSIADRVRETNGLVQAYANADPLVEYIDVFGPMLGPDGAPRADLFVEDGLHLNERGYELWESVVEPFVRR
jgi:lysophospholipase L1-like esterase